jgi:hypothetical protein
MTEVPRIYIDANIYLGIYAPTSIHLLKIVESLKEAKDNIFVTKQIEFEVQRNKVKVFADAAANLSKDFGQRLYLPPLTEDPAKVTEYEWKAKAHRATFDSNRKKLIEDLRDSNDPVSRSLEELFRSAQEASDDEWRRARRRRERGNPPGKREDPLGDQLSWEQFLSEVKDGQSVWIVSNDKDYFDEYDGKLKLKVLLHQELQSKIGSGQIHCFKKLSAAMSHFSKNAKTLARLPDTDEIDQMQSEEDVAAANTAIATSATGPFGPVPYGVTGSMGGPLSFRSFMFPGLVQQAPPPPCPKCNEPAVFSFLREEGRPETYYLCGKCGHRF